MFNGGPIRPFENIGWPLVGVMVIIVGLAMAGSHARGYPPPGSSTTGRRSSWQERSSFGAWFNRLFNLVGQVAVDRRHRRWARTVRVGILNNWFRLSARSAHILLVFADRAGHSTGLLNTFGIRLVALLNDSLGVVAHHRVVVIVAVLLIAPKHHQSDIGFIFTSFNNEPGASFPGNMIYVFLIGLLLAPVYTSPGTTHLPT